MKFLPLVILTLGLPAQAADYKSVFRKAHEYEASCGNSINSKGAEYVADAVTENHFSLDVFLGFYHSTCEFSQSAKLARKVKEGTLSKSAFDAAFGFKDSCGQKVDAFDAEIFAEGVAAGAFDIDTVLRFHKSACDIDRAMELAASAREGVVDKEAVRKAMNFESSCNTYINAEGAEWIGKEVAARSLDLDTMLSLYKKTCEFDRAGRVAKGVKDGSMSLTAFEKAYGYRGSTLGLGGCSEEIAGRGAETISVEVARGRADLDTVLEFYKSTCEFDRSLRLAKNAKSKGSPSRERSPAYNQDAR